MDRNLGGKIIHNARYIASGLVPPDSDPQSFAADVWDNLCDGVKEEYRVAADAYSGKFIEECNGKVFKVVDGKLSFVMTEERLRYVTETLRRNCRYSSTQDTLPGLLDRAIDNLKRKEEAAISKIKSFQDDILTYLRALALIATSVGNASSHTEKNARLRGMVSLIESAIQSVRNGYENLITSEWSEKPDLFRSDYPVRAYIEKIDQLQNEIKSLKSSTAEDWGEVDPDDIPM